MLRVILIDHETKAIEKVKENIQKNFPKINVCGYANSVTKGKSLIQEKKPDLAFIEMEMANQKEFQIIEYHFETIFTSKLPLNAIKAINFGAIGFILKPIQQEQLLSIIRKAEVVIKKKKELNGISTNFIKSSPPGNLIGIPTIEGYDFIKIDEIIRCEGLQNCTRVITKNRTDIISSYTIGKFTSILEPFGYFSPHKSHLINLSKIEKYYKEGTIILSDNSSIPVSKRRKSKFLKLMLLFR